MRWIIRLMVLALVFVVIAVGSILMLPSERIARIAADQIAQATGRKVEMTGETKVSFYPVLGISTGRTTVANADWSDKGPMFQADSFKVGVDPQALFGGAIRITGLEAVNPHILLQKDSSGRVNWEINVEGVSTTGGGTETAPAESSQLALTLDRALITGAQLTYIDGEAGSTTQIKDVNFDMRWPSYTGEASIDASFRPAQEVVSITGRIARLDHLIDGAVSDFAVQIGTEGGQVDFNGQVSSQPQAAGRISAELADSSRFMTSLGLAPLDLPEGFGRKASVTGDLTYGEDGRLSLRNLTAGLDHNRLTGGVDLITSGARPRIEAQLDAGALDLSALAPESEGEAGAKEAGTAVDTGWSKAPIDASALGLADAQIALSAESVDLGTFNFGRTRVLATVDNSRAVFALKELAGYGGTVAGEFVANNRSGLSVGGNMTARGMDMEKLLTDAAGITRFATTGDMSLRFLGVGQSVHAIMNSLSGELSLGTGRGVISGFDLDKLMRSGDVTGGTTVFDEMSASFAIKDGNMQGDDLKMSMPLARATGTGRIGLGAQDLNYTFTPSLLEGDSRKGLAIPVRIKGPWANPKIYPDLEAAIDLNFKAEKEKLKDDAREEVQKAMRKSSA
ncbi:AsmA family protein [Roseovarius sp. C7]|uniref:AsmA family protein n=1 Tax=Roseovarius sp. C7 TaxID=3398643 RepID=UPI0039F6C823